MAEVVVLETTQCKFESYHSHQNYRIRGIMKLPKVGDTIYVRSSLYLGHGRDDFMGGKTVIRSVTKGMSAGKMVPFITVQARPDTEYNWEMLNEEQKELKKRYGNKTAHPDPDYRPEFNDW